MASHRMINLEKRGSAPKYIRLVTQLMKNKVARGQVMGRGGRKLALLVAASLVFTIIIYIFIPPDTEPFMVNKQKYHDRNSPLIFIGGMPRSGTTLMRAMLDAHPDIRCGQETRVIPRILIMRQQMIRFKIERKRLQEAGVNEEVLNSAIASFMLEVITRHGELAPRLCNKDPYTLMSAQYLTELFPQAKLILMVRDGRATVHSLISRQVAITGFDLTSYRQCLQMWNKTIAIMYDQCQLVGSRRCMMVYYEQLVLHPLFWMREILKFLDVPWNENVLHHEDHINKPGGVPLSKLESSSDQIIKPVNVEALTKWAVHIPQDVVKDMTEVAPMLAKLGYDPQANPPSYGSPDTFVVENTRWIHDQRDLWEKKVKDLELTPLNSVKKKVANT